MAATKVSDDGHNRFLAKDLALLRSDMHFPEATKTLDAPPMATVADCPAGYLPVSSKVFTDGNVRLPFTKFFCSVFCRFNLRLHQVNPLAISRIVCFEMQCRALGICPTVPLFHHFFALSNSQGSYSFGFRRNSGVGCFSHLPDSCKMWKSNFFYLHEDEFPVYFKDEPQDPVGRSYKLETPPTPDEFSQEDVELLCRHKVQCRSFHSAALVFCRVSLAHRHPQFALAFKKLTPEEVKKDGGKSADLADRPVMTRLEVLKEPSDDCLVVERVEVLAGGSYLDPVRHLFVVSSPERFTYFHDDLTDPEAVLIREQVLRLPIPLLAQEATPSGSAPVKPASTKPAAAKSTSAKSVAAGSVPDPPSSARKKLQSKRVRRKGPLGIPLSSFPSGLSLLFLFMLTGVLVLVVSSSSESGEEAGGEDVAVPGVTEPMEEDLPPLSRPKKRSAATVLFKDVTPGVSGEGSASVVPPKQQKTTGDLQSSGPSIGEKVATEVVRSSFSTVGGRTSDEFMDTSDVQAAVLAEPNLGVSTSAPVSSAIPMTSAAVPPGGGTSSSFVVSPIPSTTRLASGSPPPAVSSSLVGSTKAPVTGKGDLFVRSVLPEDVPESVNTGQRDLPLGDNKDDVYVPGV